MIKFFRNTRKNLLEDTPSARVPPEALAEAQVSAKGEGKTPQYLKIALR